jgi:hypothetical protein
MRSRPQRIVSQLNGGSKISLRDTLEWSGSPKFCGSPMTRGGVPATEKVWKFAPIPLKKLKLPNYQRRLPTKLLLLSNRR